MTVGPAKKMWSKDKSAVTTEDLRVRKLSFREGWQVETDPEDTAIDVYGAPDLPDVGDLYPGTAQIRCVDKRPMRISPVFWIVELQYRGKIGPGGLGSSPIDIPTVWSWGRAERDLEVDEDVNGRAITTNNGEPITISRPMADITATAEKNFYSINLAAIIEFLHSVNSDSFVTPYGTFQPGVVRLTGYSITEEFDISAGGYLRLRGDFQMRYPYRTTPAKAWFKRKRHAGTAVKNSSGKIERARMDTGEYSPVPVLLKSDGTQETDPSNAYFLEYEVFQKLPYNSLGFT